MLNMKRTKYSCKFPNCKNRYYMHNDPNYKNKHFYKFPMRTRKHLLSKWKEVCNIKPDAPCTNVYVCEDHFLPQDFVNETRHRINYSVIPKDVTRINNDKTNISFDHPYVRPKELNATSDNLTDQIYSCVINKLTDGGNLGDNSPFTNKLIYYEVGYSVPNNSANKGAASAANTIIEDGCYTVSNDLADDGDSCITNNLADGNSCIANNIADGDSRVTNNLADEDVSCATNNLADEGDCYMVSNNLADKGNSCNANKATDVAEFPTAINANTEPVVEEVPVNPEDVAFCNIFVQFEQRDTVKASNKNGNDFNVLMYDKCEFLLYPFQPESMTVLTSNGESRLQNASELENDIIHKHITYKLAKLQELMDEREYINSLFRLWKNGMFKVIHEDINLLPETFITSRVRHAKNSLTIREWTAQENTIALLLYKDDLKFYKYLCSHFHLPTQKYLNALVSNISFSTGLDRSVLSMLESVVIKTDHLDRYCYLAFDEMTLDQGFHYEAGRQVIYGYRDVGHLGRSNKVAKHAFVFMLCGLRKPWKHLVAYYFIEHTMASDCYKKLIVEVISKIQGIGFNVVATVCDFNSLNRTVLEELCIETSEEPTSFYFKVDSKPIATMLNVPNLLERTRNTFFTQDVNIEGTSVAKFDHIKTLYNIDKNRKFRAFPNLNDEAFTSKDVDVKVAAAQLNKAVAAGIETLVTGNLLPVEAICTAQFVSILDTLFTSLGYEESVSKEITWRKLHSTSRHFTLWKKILSDSPFRLDNWKIIEPGTGRDKKASNNFVKGWEITLRAIMFVWDNLKTVGFKDLDLRVLNERPLADLFLSLNKYNGMRWTHFTCFRFMNALKKCVIGNCLLSETNVLSDRDALIGLLYLWVENASRNKDCSRKHVSKDILGYNIDAKIIIDDILNNIEFEETCRSCKDTLFSPEVTENGTKNSAKDYSYVVSDSLLEYLSAISDKLYKCLESYSYMDWLENRFKYAFNQKNFVTFCEVHTLEGSILDKAVKWLIYKYVQENNRTLRIVHEKHSKIL